MIHSHAHRLAGGVPTAQQRERIQYHDAADPINGQFRTQMPRRGKA